MLAILGDFWSQRGEGGAVLFAIGLILLVLAIWLIVEAAGALIRSRGRKLAPSMKVSFEE